jgi:hypothetical protein
MSSKLSALCLTLAALAVACAASAADLHDGTWKFNRDRSNIDTPPQEQTVVISEDATSRHISNRQIESSGEKVTIDVTFPLADGKANTVINGGPVESSVEVTNPTRWILTVSPGETALKVIFDVTGKELHITAMTADGEVQSVSVFDLQQ